MLPSRKQISALHLLESCLVQAEKSWAGTQDVLQNLLLGNLFFFYLFILAKAVSNTNLTTKLLLYNFILTYAIQSCKKECSYHFS